LALPFEERRPSLPIGIDAANTTVRRRHVKHHDVRIVVGQNGFQIASVYGVGPAENELADSFLICHRRCVSLLSAVPPDDTRT
jgi:hypothetical protein